MTQEVVAQTWARMIKKSTGKNVFANTRRRDVVTYRSLHVHMCRKTLKWSLQRICDFYKSNGKKSYDHATVLHAQKMFEQYCYYDKELMETMEVLSGITTNDDAILQSLQAKLNYIDPEFYGSISNCMEEAFNLTSLKNQETVQQDIKRKKEEKLYAL